MRADCRGYQGFPETQVARPGQTQQVAIPNNRAVTFLVETSDHKGPSGAELGDDQHVLLNEEASNERHGGHVPRNTRLALAAIDLVEPYVCFSPMAGGNMSRSGSGSDDVILYTGADGDGDGLAVKWYVGGAHEVDSTWLSWHRSAPPLAGGSGGGSRASAVLRGKARWALADPLGQGKRDTEEGQEGQFAASVLPPPMSMLSGGGGGGASGRGKRTEVLWLVAHAVVDQKWAPSGQGGVCRIPSLLILN